MNDIDAYQSWLEKRRSLESSPEFPKNVAGRIALYEQKRREILRRWLDWVSLRPLAQTAIIAAGLLMSAVRLMATLRILLSS
jgi:hypothetical protein